MADQSLPIKPHFFQPLLPDFRTHLNIPVAFFTKHVEGRNNQNKTAKLRSDASDKTWLVKMDGSKLTDGWEDFAFAHDFRTGDIVVFRHEGEMVFHVTALGPSGCAIQYTSSHNVNDDRNDNTNIASGNISRKKTVKKKPRKIVESSSDHSRFVAKISAWGLRNDRLYIPLRFARLNGLNKMHSKKIYLHNEEGRSWKLELQHDKTGMQTFVRSGWRRFCYANGMSQGQYTFKLVRKSAPPVIRLCRAKPRPKQRSEPESSSDHSCFEGSVNPSSLVKDQLYLPKSFVSSNGLEKRGSEIVLKNEEGRKWPLVLKQYKSNNLKSNNSIFLKKGWYSFCKGNGIKAGDSFKFKLVGTWNKPVLSLCPKESNHDKTPLQSLDDVKSLSSNPSSEEQSMEEKNFSQERLEIKKRKYWSRCRAFEDNMDDDQTNIDTGNSSRKKTVKKNPRKKEDSSSDQSSFVANVTPSSLRHDRLYLPLSFARSNGLNKMSGKRIVLLDEQVRSWKFNLKYNKSCMHTYARPGWRRFCAANGMSLGQGYTFKLVQKSGPPVMRLCLAEQPKSERPKSESSSKHSYFVGSVSASSLNKDKLYLWRSFVRSNGLDKGCKKIVLKNEWGREWTLVLSHYKLPSFTIIKRGWTSFCHETGLKAGESFKFKLVRTGENPVLSLCPADSNRDKTPLECPEGSDDVKSLFSNPSWGDDSSKSEESEKESTDEDKNISQGFLEFKKRKYCSSCRASSSYSQNRFVTLTLTPSAFYTYKLFLPRGFTQMNGINKPMKITLLSQDGVKRVVDLFQEKVSGTMRFGKGWRGFCIAHGVKVGESFELELIWEDEASPVLKFCTKVNST